VHVMLQISTGDVMGDIHGAYLTEEILKQAELDGSNIVVYALGGHQMKAAGAVLIGGLFSFVVVEHFHFQALLFQTLKPQIAYLISHQIYYLLNILEASEV
jgi:lipid A disaccharide synthetase